MGAITADNWRQLLRNPLRPDGAWKKVSLDSRPGKGYFYSQLVINGKQVKLPLRPTPGLAAVDVDKVLYKLHGAGADDNGTLTPEAMAALDGLTLEQVVAGIKATGGAAFSRGSSAFRGVFWDKQSSKWRTQFRLGGGKKASKCFEVEEDAARQYDAWAREAGKGVDELNFPQPADYQAAGLPVPANLGGAAGGPAAALAAAAAAATGVAAAAVPAPGPAAAGVAAAAAAGPSAAAAQCIAPQPLPAAASPALPAAPSTTSLAAAAASVPPLAAAPNDNSSSHIARLAARLASPEEHGWVDSEDEWSDDGERAASADEDEDKSCALDTSHSADGISGISAGAAALITAYLQLHGDGPIPPEALAVFGMPHTAIPQQPAGDAAASGAQPAGSTANALQFDRLRLTPGLQGLISSARRWRGTNVVSLSVTGGGGQQQQAGSAAAAAAAGSSSGQQHTRPVTTLVLESVAAPPAADSALLQAAMCQAAVEVTQAPRVIRAAAKAAAAWGNEVPQQLVYDIEAGIRFAASREIRRLRPGNSHYWRGTATWQRLIDDDANNKAVAAAALAAGRSPPRAMTPQETAAAASAIAFKAASPHDAAEACIAAAAAAGRSCTPPDLHAAWLAQRLGAGEVRVEVVQPAVDMAVLEQALRDNEVQPIPGIDYEPVPGLDPELVWPTPDDAPTASSGNGRSGDSPAAAAVPPPAAAGQQQAPQAQQPRGVSAGFDLSAALAAAHEHWAKAEAPYSAETYRVPFDQQDSRGGDDDEEHEAAWMVNQLRQHAAAAAAAAPGSGAAASFVAAAAAAGPGAAGSVFQGVGLSREGRAQVAQQLAELRRQGEDMRGFDKANIPTVDLPLTGDAMADTVALLQAFVAEGDADHLPSHVRSYRMAKMVQQVMPSWDADAMVEALGKPLEGDYCPVVLVVPPPHPSLPARAAAAAANAAAAAGYAPLADDFDPVNRLPAQALALPGCSHRGHEVAARRAAAAGAAAAAASGATEPRVSDSTAPAGNEVAARLLRMAHGGALVSLLRPLQPEDSRQPGGGWPQQQEQQEHGSDEAGAAAARATTCGGLGGTTAGVQAGRAAALAAAVQLPCGAQFAAGSVAAAEAAAAAADTLAAASAPAPAASRGSPVAQQPEGAPWLNPVLLAAATTAPVLCAGAEPHTFGGEAAVIGAHAPAAVLQSAAEAATAAAAAALQPCPMLVDWVADEDMASELGMWAPAEQLAGSRMDAARRAAKDQAAGAAAVGKGSDAHDEEMADAQAGSGSSKGNGGGGEQQQQQQQQRPTVITGFIMADSHPGIDTAHAAALGLQMPRPLASVHTYQPGTPAAEAAAAAVRALVPGQGLTFCTTEPPPAADQPGAHCSGSARHDSSPLDCFVDPPDDFGAELVRAAAAAAVGDGDSAAAEACALLAEQGDVLALPFYPAAGSLHDTSRRSFKQLEDAQRAKAEATVVRVQRLELLAAADSRLTAVIDACNEAEVAAATAARDAALRQLHGGQSATTEASDVWVDSWEQYTASGTAAAPLGGLHVLTTPATNPVHPQASSSSVAAPAAAAVSTTAAPQADGTGAPAPPAPPPAPPPAEQLHLKEGREHRARVSMALARGLQIMAACNAAEAAAKARGVSDPQQLQAVEEAATRRVLSGVPGGHQSRAVLAARAGRRMQSELLGVENPPDVFDCYFQVQPPPPGFYQRVRCGEVGTGEDQGLALDERCVPLEEVLDYAALPHGACMEAWERDRRFREERDIVRAARHHVLIAMTTPPDGICYQLVAGAGLEAPGMSHLDVAVRAQMIMRGEV